MLPWWQTKTKNTNPLFNDATRADDDPVPESEKSVVHQLKSTTKPTNPLLNCCTRATSDRLVLVANEDQKYKPFVQ